MRLGRDVRLRIGAMAAALLEVVSGCAPAPRPLELLAPSALLRHVYATPGATWLQARGKIQVTTADGGYSGGLLLFYRHPDSLRVVIQAGLGTTFAEVALTGQSGVAYLPHQEHAFALTPASAIIVGSTTMYPSLLARLLAPAESERFGDSLSVAIDGRDYFVRGASPSGVRTWQIDGRTLELEAEEFTAAEASLAWRRTFKLERNVRVPRTILVRLGDTTTAITLTHVDVAPRWRGNEFRVRVPPDIEVIAGDRE